MITKSPNYYVIIDETGGQDFEKLVNKTLDHLEGALGLLESYRKDYPTKIFAMYKRVKE